MRSAEPATGVGAIAGLDPAGAEEAATRAPARPSTALVPWRPKPGPVEVRPRATRYGAQMPRRGPALTWLTQTLTLGIGHVRWLRAVSRELGELDDRAEVDLRRTTLAVLPGVLLVVPALLAWYRLGRRIARTQYAAGLEPSCRAGLGLLLAPLLGTITRYYQAELNKIADCYGFPAGVAVPLYG